jgi:hypothetical protein
MNDGSPRLDDDGDLIVVAVDEPVESHRARAFSSNAWEHTMQAVMWMGLGVNSMRRFSGWALAIATTVFAFVGYIFQQVIADFIKQQPQEAANSALKFLHAALKFLHDLSEQTWFLVTASFLVGFAAGFLVKWLLQKLDGSRAKQREALADERVALGTKMVKLGDDLDDLRSPIQQAGPEIRSCFATAKRLGLWVPDQRVFAMHPDRATLLVEDYLRQVGTLLKDGNFSSAKQYAKANSKHFFDEAYAEFNLSSTQALSF